MRRARFFDFFRRLPLFLDPPPGYPPPNLPLTCKTLCAVLKAAEKDDEFWPDFAIAAKFRKRQSRVNCFLAEYSVLMLGKQPALTFGEVHKILHWVGRDDLRKTIKTFRKRYGELVVPLKPGKPGRSRKK